MAEDTNCPRCGQEVLVEIEKYEDGSEEIECDTCGATLEISYSVSVRVNVNVSDVPAAEFECPGDDSSMSIDDIDEEYGRREVNCEGCGAVLEVSWSNWGQDSVEVKVIEEGKEDEEEDEDDEDDEDIGDKDEWSRDEKDSDDEDEVDSGDEDEDDEEW